MGKATEILLVEDDPHDVELILRVFRENNLANTVKVARDGAEALAYLFPSDSGQKDSGFRFILLDLKLPKVDGMEVLRRVKSDSQTKTIPVVVLTSSREMPDLKAAYELGVNSYLCKPVDFQDFMDVVKQAGLYWMLLNEPLS